MAGSSFLSPQGVSPSRSPRRFTLAQANATLPLVKRIVADIVGVHRQLTAKQSALEAASKADQPKLQAELQKQWEQLQDYVDELLDVGCELKDFRIGLIDFVAQRQGREIYLCWKLGEESIAYWHELNAGYGGRQPIGTLEEEKAEG